MATIVQKLSSGSQSLADFQTVIQQEEGIWGPLQVFSYQGTNNVITFSVDTSPTSDKRAFLETYSDHPATKTNASLICATTCLIGGVVTNVAAYRPK